MACVRLPEFVERHNVSAAEALGVRELRVLGRGVSSEVVLAVEKSSPEGKKKALKKIVYGERESLADKLKRWSFFLNEVNILKELSHPNIIELQRALSCREELVLVLELHVSDLASALPHVTDFGVIRFFTQSTSALTYLHQRRIVHGDVKPQNVLLHHTGKMVRLCDFGFAQRLPENKKSCNTYSGTPAYLGPEFTTGQPVQDVYKLESFALGRLLCSLLFREKAKLNVDYLPLIRENATIPATMKECAQRLLEPSPTERATAWQIDQFLTQTSPGAPSN
ncbi:serine/threonine-protein kinase nekl-2-like [Aplysia californica]|uniref:Serine/threonine-protein kinase nekl-2-like n=1 Tax=Aplysia californica TaxID=6500 RepID=A0ABM1AD03_APLCA|nr:serine/threonine-protein kinase nekl-2-like [Aplysia californica]